MSNDSDNILALKSCIGDSIQLQFSPGNEDERYYVKLIGFLQDKSILVTMPKIQGQTIRVPEGQLFVAPTRNPTSFDGMSMNS